MEELRTLAQFSLSLSPLSEKRTRGTILEKELSAIAQMLFLLSCQASRIQRPRERYTVGCSFFSSFGGVDRCSSYTLLVLSAGMDHGVYSLMLPKFDMSGHTRKRTIVSWSAEKSLFLKAKKYFLSGPTIISRGNPPCSPSTTSSLSCASGIVWHCLTLSATIAHMEHCKPLTTGKPQASACIGAA